MLGVLISILGIDLSHKINYFSNYIPQVKKEIVIEEPEPIAIPEVEKPPVKEYDPVACSCVIFASQFLDLPKNTDAIDLISNSQPYIGGGILLNYESIGHIAIIIDFKDNGFLVKESNYKECKYTTRLISFDDPAIRGFYTPREI